MAQADAAAAAPADAAAAVATCSMSDASDQRPERRNTDGPERPSALSALQAAAALWSPVSSSNTTSQHASSTTATSAVDAASTTHTSISQRFPGLRQLYSGAASWRASLRGKPKSSTTETSVSSRPVIVRTYSGGTSASGSRAGHQRSQSLPSRHGHRPNALSSSSSASMPVRPQTLPPAADFSFDGILHAVEPEIAGAIDAIAAICARSKLSLADEYAAHRPPHEVLDPAIPLPAHRQQHQRWWSVVRDTALSAVPEASSSSERLVGSKAGSRASVSSAAGHSSRGRRNSAYGSLKSIVSGDGHARKGFAALFGSGGEDHEDAADYPEPPSPSGFHHPAQWMVADSSHPSIRLSRSHSVRAASPRVSLATSEEPMGAASAANGGAGSHRPTRPRSSSFTWLPWPADQQQQQQQHPQEHDQRPVPEDPTAGTVAEQRLKELLRTAAPPSERRKPIGGGG